MAHGVHGLKTALLLYPLEHEAQHVDVIARGCVIHGVFADHGLIGHHKGSYGLLTSGKRFVNDNKGYTGGSQIFLGTGENNSEFAYIQRLGQNVGGHIGYKRDGNFGDIMPLRTEDGIVSAVVKILCVGIQLQLGLVGNTGVVACGGVDGDIDGAVLGGLLCGDLCEVAGDGIIGALIGSHKVQGNHGKLGRSSALKEKYLVGIGHGEKFLQIGLGFVENREKG